MRYSETRWFTVIVCSPQDATPKKGSRSKTLAADWKTRRCLCCHYTATHPSPQDLAEGRSVRKWLNKYYWADLCWWCVRMAAVMYAHLSTSLFGKLMANDAERNAAAFAAYCYMTLRAEGKVHVTLQALSIRIALLKDAAKAFWCNHFFVALPAIRLLTC